jgi:pyruvate dehydrogenase E1 component beta subunit
MAYTKIVDALKAAIIEEMDADPNVVMLGEDISVFGGAYRVSEGLRERYGERRVCDTPISEIAIAGAAIGAAMTGLRPIAEFQFNDFMACAMDQICNQAAKIRLMMGGQVMVPLVFRAPYGATGRAAQHSQSLEAWFAHTPGLKVVMPSTPYDAKGLMKSAIRDNNPVVFLEHKMLYGAASPGGKAKTAVDSLGDTFRPAPEEPYFVEIGKADVKREGSDITIVATGLMVHKAAEAAKELAAGGISTEIIDPRTIAPLDMDIILNSLSKTGRLLIATESVGMCGIAAEIAAQAAEYGIYSLDAPVRRVCAKNAPIPFAPLCEADVIPSKTDIVSAAREICTGK